MKSSQLGLFVVLGLVFWLTGLLMIRFLGPTVFVDGSPLQFVMYAAAFPLLLISIWIASRISGVPMNAMLEPTVVITFSAIFVDGAVIGWFPQAYGEDTVHVMRGAAWLLWGAAAGLLWAWWLQRRSR